jgi:hypothetical protein
MNQTGPAAFDSGPHLDSADVEYMDIHLAPKTSGWVGLIW